MAPRDPHDLPTRAMILAAGWGTRLRPLTDTTPKCMVRIGGRPLLEYTLRWIRQFGVTEIVVNLHHLPRAVTSYFGDGTAWGLRIRYSVEERPLGTAGGVKRMSRFFGAPFFVWYGDNLSTCLLDRLWASHRAKGGIGTIALYHRRDAVHSGIVGLDRDNRVRRFLEKPKPQEVFTHWVNAGIFVLEPEIVKMIPSRRCLDFGRDVFPDLLARNARLYGYRMSKREKLHWIDRPEDLRRLETRWPRLGDEFSSGGKPG
ncbi:MAG TPA: nucleotidyltransferase family protein [bacterium]|nr:nucleotidyltransferase family protein [bacterium]